MCGHSGIFRSLFASTKFIRQEIKKYALSVRAYIGLDIYGQNPHNTVPIHSVASVFHTLFCK